MPLICWESESQRHSFIAEIKIEFDDPGRCFEEYVIVDISLAS